ncbi:hypothetical protein HYE68_001639 [Fusarium pseudograminearum]|nr:hypothetical protein HYE68_001639 [Fusarium pseudograminearum]
MATLDALHIAFQQQIPSEASTKALSDDEYQQGFDLFLHHNGWSNYRDFVIPKLSQLLHSQFDSRKEVSVLEVGPGPKSVFGYLPNFMRQKITSYTAYEPNRLFAEKLEAWLHPSEDSPPFPSLCTSSINIEAFTQETVVHEKQHVILFCHSLYDVSSKDQVVRHALGMLSREPDDGILVVCHRDTAPFLNDLVCQRSAIFPDGTVRIKDSNDTIDRFASFVAGCSIQPDKMRNATHDDWRNVCRNLAYHENNHPDTLTFASPEVIMTFTRNSTALPELTAVVPPASKDYKVKNREAQSHAPAAVVRPTEVGQVQRCVTWALRHRFCLTIVSGGHSGHCRWRNVVSVDMGAFDQVHIVRSAGGSKEGHPLVVAGSGCKTGDIIQAALSEGLTVPLGARPSVGSGLWLQGGIGHLLRAHGLACDAIVGAVLVSVESGQALCVGEVPYEHQPIGSARPNNEDDLLWSLKGAGNNFGIIISVTFKAYPARSFSVKDWSIELKDEGHAKYILQKFASALAHPLDRESSVDAYLYYVNAQLMLGVTLFQSMETTTGKDPSPVTPESFTQEVASDATAFGCRDWDFACVVTGVWPRENNDSPIARATTRWVYDVVEALLPVSQGVYGADLGPDPRDAILATKAFGPNLRKLVKMKQIFDPHGVLAYACPLSKDMLSQKMVVLVTGEHGAGKDYCANIWAAAIKGHGYSTAVLSISDATKREYASHTGASLVRLLEDRAYKEQHREALAAFFGQQMEHRPHLAEEHFTEAVRSADVDVLFITGMREEAPVANLWHLVSDVRLVEVHVKASQKTRGLRRQHYTSGDSHSHENINGTETLVLNYRPNFIFHNDTASDNQVKAFAKQSLLPFVGDDLQRLAGMVPSVPDFPRPGIQFRHVLEIGQQKGGYKLCASLFKQHFAGDWRKIDVIVSCDVGGHIFAASLAPEVNVHSILVRPPGKLPPPTISVEKSPSHVSSHVNGVKVEGNEMRADTLRKGARVLVIDDVLATGNTLLSMLKLLNRAGIEMEDTSVMVVAEFPIHRGRQKLRQGGFGRIGIQSLLVFDGE